MITVPPGHAATSRAVVTLPADLGLDLTAFSAVCSAAQRAADACPPATRVGRAIARTLRVRSRAARRITVTLASGAVTASRRKRLRFTLRTRDAAGRSAKLTLRP